MENSNRQTMIKLTTTLLLIVACLGAMGQTKKAKKDSTHVDAKIHGLIPANPDTSERYTLTFKDLQLFYNLMQDGLNGVASSPHYSQDQAQAYKAAVLHMDSLFKPQVVKWHPVKEQPKKQ